MEGTVSGHLNEPPPLPTMGGGSDSPVPDPRFPRGRLQPRRLLDTRSPARLQRAVRGRRCRRLCRRPLLPTGSSLALLPAPHAARRRLLQLPVPLRRRVHPHRQLIRSLLDGCPLRRLRRPLPACLDTLAEHDAPQRFLRPDGRPLIALGSTESSSPTRFAATAARPVTSARPSPP